jgi:hypothetical protein
MRQESSITFSPGQEKKNDLTKDTTLVGGSDEPIYTFGGVAPTGASQPSPTRSTFFLSQGPREPAFLTEGQDPSIPSGVTFPPSLKLGGKGREATLKTRQLWEGTITEVREGGFAAVLNDRTNSGNPDERGSFSFDSSDISEEDRQFLNPGASFYWIIGSELSPAGQVTTVSRLQFRRVPAWNQRALSRAIENARRRRESFQEDV